MNFTPIMKAKLGLINTVVHPELGTGRAQCGFNFLFKRFIFCRGFFFKVNFVLPMIT